MGGQDRLTVVGAGVIGCAIAWALAREGRAVTLLDRHAPGAGGASSGNAGHLATDHVEPLPSPALLLGFWRELFALGGPLDLPWRTLGAFAPWAKRFAAAAFRREAHTAQLAPLVRPAAEAWERWLRLAHRPDLLRRNGHYQLWLGPEAARAAAAESRHLSRLAVATTPMAPALVAAIAAAAGSSTAAGLWFPDSGHVIDPLEVCRALAAAAAGCGAAIERTEVRALAPRGTDIEMVTAGGTRTAAAVVVCAGAWSAPLLAPFGLSVPLAAARGYHLELPGGAAHVDAPLVYMDRRIVVTPMSGRLRASAYMEFAPADAPSDPRKLRRLGEDLARLGYRTRPQTPPSAWVGARPVLPDYLPGIGRAPGAARLYYAIGHQHIGLTLAPVSAELIAALVAGREPACDVRPFDLRRFG